MKKLSLVLLIAVMLAGGAVTFLSAPSCAQYYVYQTPPPNPYAQPWVGSNTPWTYYNGDWFLNGILYYFFGSQYGWCPYYSYPPTYIVRPQGWYAPQWQTWYRGHPRYWEHFRSAYPYWRTHRVGQRYDERFYERHHHGQPGGWQTGFHGRPAPPIRPQGPRPGPGHEGPPPGHFTPPPGHGPGPGPVHQPPTTGPRPGPGQVAPTTRPGTPPGHFAPPPAHQPPTAGPRPGPGQVSPPGHGPAPTRVAPPPTQRPAPSQGAPRPAPKQEKGGQAPQPEKGGPGPGAH